jgi:hypothetical protein
MGLGGIGATDSAVDTGGGVIHCWRSLLLGLIRVHRNTLGTSIGGQIRRAQRGRATTGTSSGARTQSLRQVS